MVVTQFECTKCTFNTSSLVQIGIHMDAQHQLEAEMENPKTIGCTECTFTTDSLDQLRSHVGTGHSSGIEIKQPIFIECRSCPFRACDQSYMASHMEVAHKVRGPGVLHPCPLHCGYSGTNEQVVKMHVMAVHNERKEELKFDTDVTDKTFLTMKATSYSDLASTDFEILKPSQEIIMEVEGILANKKKVLNCSRCPYKSNIIFRIRRHVEVVHFAFKRFACKVDGCELKFARMERLTQHLRESHKKKKQTEIKRPKVKKSYTCEQCDFRSVYQSSMFMHKVVHSDEKMSFACDKCDFKSNYKSNFTRHMSIHTAEQSFACDQCDYESSQKRNLTRHKAIHMKEKPFTCDQCDYKTALGRRLKNHKITHNKERPYMCYEYASLKVLTKTT